METVPVVRMSPKGRVVIPEDIRERLGLQAGAELAVFEGKDSLILKAFQPPVAVDFDRLARETRRYARKAGMKRSDITKAIAAVRGRQ